MKRVRRGAVVFALAAAILFAGSGEAQATHRLIARDTTGLEEAIIGYADLAGDGTYDVEARDFDASSACGVAQYASADSGGWVRVPGGSNPFCGSGSSHWLFQAANSNDALYFRVCKAGNPSTCGTPVLFTDT
jgi:hypothetical protein